MKTLSELNPKVGDSVLFHSYYKPEPEEYIFEKREDYYWYLRPAGGGDLWHCTGDANCPKWTLKPKEQTMKTLSELKPKAGDTVLLSCVTGEVKEYLFEGREGDGWLLRPQAGGEISRCRSSVAALPIWTLNPQPKESKVTVADLNLSAGDRVTDGKRQGTVTCVWPNSATVLWDWYDFINYPLSSGCTLTKLPKPEPTLADLNLKAGDPVQITVSGAFALVCQIDKSDDQLALRLYNGKVISYNLSEPATRLKKLEVPK